MRLNTWQKHFLVRNPVYRALKQTLSRWSPDLLKRVTKTPFHAASEPKFVSSFRIMSSASMKKPPCPRCPSVDETQEMVVAGNFLMLRSCAVSAHAPALNKNESV
jgi:hypothetical protein